MLLPPCCTAITPSTAPPPQKPPAVAQRLQCFRTQARHLLQTAPSPVTSGRFPRRAALLYPQAGCHRSLNSPPIPAGDLVRRVEGVYAPLVHDHLLHLQRWEYVGYACWGMEDETDRSVLVLGRSLRTSPLIIVLLQ